MMKPARGSAADGGATECLALPVLVIPFLLGAPAMLAQAEPAEYELDPDHLTVGFLVEHAGFASVVGRFLEASGSYRFDEDTGELSDLRVTVDTSSVTTEHRERDEHLRSEEFLNSDKYPEMVFAADSAQRIDARTFEVPGRLELLGETRPVTLTATWNKSGTSPFSEGAYVMGVSARGSFERSDFGMTYGVENGWVADEVELLIEFEARRR